MQEIIDNIQYVSQRFMFIDKNHIVFQKINYAPIHCSNIFITTMNWSVISRKISGKIKV